MGVRDGRIVVIEPFGAQLDAEVVVELGDDEVLIPGLVDTHVHVNEPGRTEWEGFASATRAAAAGGVTTIVDMPLNSIPPTVDAEALDVKRRVASDQAYVDLTVATCRVQQEAHQLLGPEGPGLLLTFPLAVGGVAAMGAVDWVAL